MKKIKIAIDGYSGCGKSSTAVALARHFKYKYIDSGAMYRGVTYLMLESNIEASENHQLAEFLQNLSMNFHIIENGDCHLFSENIDLEPFLRTMQVNRSVSEVSAIGSIREKLVAEQRRYGSEGGIVMDGRDIGTVVFPEAELKLFLTADLEIRAKRRMEQLVEGGQQVEIQEIIDNFKRRDEIDTSRDISPLTKADDAIEIDTSYLTFGEQVDQIIKLAEQKINEG